MCRCIVSSACWQKVARVGSLYWTNNLLEIEANIIKVIIAKNRVTIICLGHVTFIGNSYSSDGSPLDKAAVGIQYNTVLY